MKFKFFNSVIYSLVSRIGAELIRRFFMNPDRGYLIKVTHDNRLLPEYCWLGGKLGMRYYDVVVGGPLTICKSKDTRWMKRILDNISTKPVLGCTVMPDQTTV